jgi:hypothetical protein
VGLLPGGRAAGLSAPFDAAVAAAQQDRETEWHRDDFERPPNAPSDLTSVANAERSWISEEMLDPATLDEPEGFVSLVWELVRKVGFAYAKRNHAVVGAEVSLRFKTAV